MASDRIVSARHVLSAILDLQRRGSTSVLSELEKLEPDLVEYLLENLTQLHHTLVSTGIPTKRVRRLYHQAESMTLVCLMALRHAYRELWEPSEPPSPSDDQPPVN